MVDVPLVTPLTKPEEGLTVAADILLLLQVPPLAPLVLSWLVAPVQNVVVPLMVPALGAGLTVTVALAQLEFPQSAVSQRAK